MKYSMMRTETQLLFKKKQTDKSVFIENFTEKTETTHSNSYGKSGYNNN